MINIFTKSGFLFFAALLLSNFLSAQVSGKIFQDFNSNGVQDNTPTQVELGLSGVVVLATNPTGGLLTVTYTGGGASTNTSGEYTVTGGILGQIRLEFILPTGVYATKGSTGGTTVIFPSGATQNLAVSYPKQYCQSDPDVIVPCYVSGDPEGGGTGGSMDALVRFPYTRTGSTPKPTLVATASQIGTVWGSAYQRESKKLILASFLKRHCGLKSLGLGGLYLVDLTNSPGTVSSYINIENYGINLNSAAIAGRTLPASATAASNDPLAFDNVGKIGLGSIDLSDDGSQLWMVNLHEKTIIRFNIGNPVKPAGSVTNADFTSFSIPNPGCTNGVFRPWALEYYQGKIYVGGICSAENTGGSVSNMFAYVYEFNPVTETWGSSPLVSFSLNYPKGYVHVSFPAYSKWEPWVSTFAQIYSAGSAGSPPVTRKMRPQPILTDIQFDQRGNMILGFSDRTGHQTGRVQYGTTGTATFNGYVGGDILMLKKTGTSSYTLENNATFPSGPTGSAPNNNQGPGNGEFFGNDFFDAELVLGSGVIEQIHQETMQGGMFYNASRDEIMANQIDPFVVFSGGVVRHRVSDGYNDDNMRYEIYDTRTVSGTFGKANGLGLLDMVCDPAPLEIGNRIWLDANKNGIQDAGEGGIDGLTVLLFEGGIQVASTTTSNGGQYYFTNDNVLGGVKYFTNYEIRVPVTQAPLNGMELTTTDAGSSDNLDNDGMINGNDAVKTFFTAAAGHNNHSFDFGFKQCIVPSGITISPTIATCTGGTPNNDGSLTLTSVTDADKFGVSTGATYSGPAYASATAIGTLPQTLQNNIPNAGGTYSIRFFNEGDDCYKDTTISIAPVCCLEVALSPTDSTICPGGSFVITATTTGGLGTCTFQWQYLDGATWANLMGETNSTLNTGALVQTRLYRVIYDCPSCAPDPVVSAPTTVTVVSDPQAGLVGNAVTVCSGGGATLTAQVTGGSGTPSYQWQSSTDGNNFSNISGETNINLTVSGLLDTMFYRMQVSFTGAGCDVATSGVDTINVVPDPSVSVTGGGSICAGDSLTLFAVVDGGTGTCTLQWQRLVGVSSWVNVGVPNSPTFNTGALFSNEKYRARYSCTGSSCDIALSEEKTITVNPQPNLGVDQHLTCPSGGGAAPSTYDFNQTGNWTVLSQPNGASASVSNDGEVSGMTVAGEYEFQIEINGCTDAVKIIVPTCCPVPTCLPVQVIKIN